jgi:hypothetical protein
MAVDVDGDQLTRLQLPGIEARQRVQGLQGLLGQVDT